MSAPAIVAVRDAFYRAPAPPRTIAIALLGLGQIGSAVARLAAAPDSPARLTVALVRDTTRRRAGSPALELTRDIDRVFDRRPDVVVEVLGGLEPARTFVRAAIERRIPVVTANKALIAHHGAELLDLAARTGTPVRYEASVLAGVPFLGTFAGRPHAARISQIAGILNGTSNVVLSRAAETGASIDDSVAEAQRLGLAEPDPADDVDGVDAAHKLAVLAWHFGLGSVTPGAIETRGLRQIEPADLAAARSLGGTIKPVAWLEQTGGGVSAFVGPAFVAASHRLSSISGVENAVTLAGDSGALFFSGPGAGPAPTAATILDDVVEAARGEAPAPRPARRATVTAPATSWLLRVGGASHANDAEVAAFLGAHGIWARQAHAREHTTWRLTYPCSRERLDAALASLSLATACHAVAIRALEG